MLISFGWDWWKEKRKLVFYYNFNFKLKESKYGLERKERQTPITIKHLIGGVGEMFFIVCLYCKSHFLHIKRIRIVFVWEIEIYWKKKCMK